jgi:hypothetical protein
MHFNKIMPGCSKSVFTDDSVVSPTVIPANTSTSVLTDVSKSYYHYSRVFVQNVGTTNGCYIAFGNTCDLSNYDVYLAAASVPFEVTPYLGPISAFCNTTGGTTIAAVRFFDREQNPGQGNIVSPAAPIQ